MGCGASRQEYISGSREPLERLPPEGKPLEEWEAQEVSGWFSSLVPDLQKYRSSLLPDEGCIVAQWTEQHLISRGVSGHDAMRLITYRNKAMSRAKQPGPTAAPGLASPTSGSVVLGIPDPSAAPTISTIASTATAHLVVQTTQRTVGNSNQQQPVDVGSTNTRRDSLMALLAKGVKLARNCIRTLGPSLPFPGAEAANLVVMFLDLVDGAIANHANLMELRQRAVAFLDILVAYQEELSNLRPPRYKGVVDDFQELLQGIIAYTRIYCERNCITRLLTGGSDQEQYQALVASLGALSQQVMMLVAADSNARLQQLQRTVDEATRLLAQTAEYQDPAAAARALVAELGGLDSVLADEDKLRRVKLQLDVGSQVTIKVVESLLLSHLDQGPQRLIRHPDLRVFWMKQYASITEVPWFDFWEQFPEQLKENPVELALVSELSNMLGDGRARTAFQLAVERGNKDCISVWELKLAFSGDEGLLPQVERLLTSSPKSKPVAGATKVGTAAASAERQGAPLAAGAVQAPTVMPLSSPAPVVRCQLPPLVSNYTGREDEAAAVVSHLVNHGSIALLAPGGMGKSCLAIDVGWRLMNSGAAAAGALWVDLREASSLAEVEARFCASLGLQAEKQDNAPRILAALKAAAAAPASSTAAESNVSPPDGALGSGQAHMHGVDLAGSGYPGMASRPPPMQVLVVVDNAEDALLHPGAAESVRGLLSKVLREAPSVRMLITSRVTLGMCSAGLTERPVGAIAADAATLLIRSVAADLTEAEAASVADACKCVPLLLCLVAEALVAGRLTLEDLDKLQARGTAGGEPVDATGSTVRLVLSSLKRQHQQAAAQLAVFPSAFDDEAAAAIWGNTPPQARALLAVLHRYSVVQRSSGQHYLMHMVVRRQSAEQGHRIDPGLQLNVEGRFVNWMLGLLREWSVMYHTVKEWRLAMTMARDHQADVSKLFQLLASGFEEGFSGSWKGPAAGEVAPAQGGTSGPRPSPPNGSNSSRSPPPCCWDPAVVASELTDNLRQMFEGLGLLGRMETPCLALLKRLGAEPQLLPPQAPAAGSAPPAPLQHMQPAAGPQPQELQQPLAVASVLYMRAWVRVRGGRMYKEAEEDARRSWELRHAALGPEHPDTVISLYILAAALGYLRRYSEAEVFNRQVLDLQLRLLGELHSDTAYSINGLAVCVDKQGRFTEAEEMYKRALNIRRQVLGERHPCTAGSLNNLAGSIYGQGRRAEAEELYRQALELRRQVIGEEHPDTIATLANLSSCTFDQGRYDEAEPLLRQTLELRRRVLGEDHPDTVQSLTSLAACLDGLEGREAEAEALHRQAVRISLSTLGRTHPTTRSRLVRLGNCMEVQGAAFNAEAVLAELEGSMN